MEVEWTNELKLDFEQRNPQKRLSIPRIKFVSRLLRLPIKNVEAYRTTNGIHVKIQLEKKVHPITAVLIQALCNSDYAREAYNAIRVYNLTLHPEKYDSVAHECWNVLYYKKLVDGKVASEEKFDPKLTRRLKRELLRDEAKP
jgi:hypothetical protein